MPGLLGGGLTRKGKLIIQGRKTHLAEEEMRRSGGRLWVLNTVGGAERRRLELSLARLSAKNNKIHSITTFQGNVLVLSNSDEFDLLKVALKRANPSEMTRLCHCLNQ